MSFFLLFLNYYLTNTKALLSFKVEDGLKNNQLLFFLCWLMECVSSTINHLSRTVIFLNSKSIISALCHIFKCYNYSHHLNTGQILQSIGGKSQVANVQFFNSKWNNFKVCLVRSVVLLLTLRRHNMVFRQWWCNTLNRLCGIIIIDHAISLPVLLLT